MPEQRYCSKCRKTMADTNFYTYKDGTKCELCKACLTMHVNNWEPDTYLWILKQFDYPYIEEEWIKIRDKEYAKDPYKITGMTIIGRYFAKMKLKQFKGHDTWADTEYWKEKAQMNRQQFGEPEAIAQQKLEDMKQAYENGEITEAQYLTYAETHAPEPTPEVTNIETHNAGGGKPQSPYPVNNTEFEVVELPDVGNDLTEEDKVYLAMKWGRLYRPDEWVALEQKYNDFIFY